MAWHDRYQSSTHLSWLGRNDLPAGVCFFQQVTLVDLVKAFPSPNKSAFALLGFCCDEGIRRNAGRIGAADGPHFIRKALAKLPLQRQNIFCYDVGNIICQDGQLELAQAALAEVVSLLLEKNITPIILGGGHELAWGNFQGIIHAFPQKTLGIVNFDAHFDMRPLLPNGQGSSGTPFLQMAKRQENQQKPFHYYCIGIQESANIQTLFDTAKHYHTEILLAENLYQGNINQNANFIEKITTQNDILYLSICLDVFAAAYAPGVSAPQPLGLTPWQVIPLIRKLAASHQVIAYDIAEMSPTFDIDERTAKLTANLIYEIIHHHAN